MPTRLAGTLAEPNVSVTALPTAVPFSEKLIVLPAIGLLPESVNVAERVVFPPYVPLAAATVRTVVIGWLTVTLTLAELLAAFASTAELLLTLTLLSAMVPSGIARLVAVTRVTVWVSPLCSR